MAHQELSAAAARGDRAGVEALLRKDADMNARDSQGRTPLDIARLKGRTRAVEWLQTQGARAGA